MSGSRGDSTDEQTMTLEEARAAYAKASAAVAEASINKASASSVLVTARTAQSKIESVKAEAAQKVVESSTASEAEKEEAAKAAKEASANAAELARLAQQTAEKTVILVKEAKENVESAAGHVDLNAAADLQESLDTVKMNADAAKVSTANNTADMESSEAEIATKASVILANSALRDVEDATSDEKLSDLRSAVDAAQDAVSGYSKAVSDAKELTDKASKTLSANDLNAADAANKAAETAGAKAVSAIDAAEGKLIALDSTLDKASVSVNSASGIEGFDYDAANAALGNASDKVKAERSDLDTASASKRDSDSDLKESKSGYDSAVKAAAENAAVQANKQAAKKVTDAINAINQASPDKTAVANARKLYDALNAKAKAFVDANTLKKLTAAEKAVKAEAARQGTADTKIPKVKIKKPVASKTAVTVKWTKLTSKQLKKSKAKKYEIWVCPDKSFKAGNTKIKTASKSKSSFKVSGLKKGSTYYVKVRAIRSSGGVKYVGKWSAVKQIKTKKK
jgi:hypothetical protein